uniref:Predicted protein n=1 Tax=Physcomitrium patens TaxID=3218 RepID=A9U6U7_PHYPA
MANKSTPETILRFVAVRPVDQITVEEQNVSPVHDGGNGFPVFWRLDQMSRKRFAGVCFLRAYQRIIARFGNDEHSAVFFIRRVDGGPGRNAVTRFDLQVEVVLMQRLPA